MNSCADAEVPLTLELLPEDNLLAIAAAGRSAQTLTALLQTSRRLRCVFNERSDEAWEPLTFSRFPRVSQLLDGSRRQRHPSFQTLYRRLLESEVRPTHPGTIAAPLENFRLTVELLLDGEIVASGSTSPTGSTSPPARTCTSPTC